MAWGERAAEQHEKDQPSEVVPPAVAHCGYCHHISSVYLGKHGISCPVHGGRGCPVERETPAEVVLGEDERSGN